MRCASPNCPTDRAENSNFCERHRDLFAEIAAEIDDGKVERLRHYRRKRRTLFKECAAEGCSDCAAPRESYCDHHLEVLARRGVES